MTTPPIIWGAPQWAGLALGLFGASAIAVAWSYGRARVRPRVRWGCAALKALGFTLLAVSLLEPLLTGTRPRRGANAFAVVVDNSRSLGIRDGDGRPRGDALREALKENTPWRTRLGQDFDTREYLFDSHLRAVGGFGDVAFDGNATALASSLDTLAKRFRGLPLAGVLLFTDGNRTDAGDVDWSKLPPVYPVAPPARGNLKDVGVRQVSVTQANFEAAPVVLRADVTATGYPGETIVADVLDGSGHVVERQEAKAAAGDSPISFRFQFRPEKKGVTFYSVKAYAARDAAAMAPDAPEDAETSEQTTANNSRLVVVDQGGGPYRILYVGGRPGWEFKFLRRALHDDEQVQIVGMIRIAKRQPKFDFQSAGGRRNSPLFDGFDNPDAETAERQDQPVLVRLGTLDEAELRDGFPKSAEELYRYHAIVLDDLEAGFFTQDQLALVRSFVAQRGGGLLMLGGSESFGEGGYDRTPVGELLPVYLTKNADDLDPPPGAEYRLALTREGWLQPWVRTRKTEEDEKKRLAGMAPFRALNVAGSVKPGAVVLAQVLDAAGVASPALVAQQFGKGHVASLLIGDLWRWGIKRADPEEDDLDRSWRQTARWLVGDVPGRVDVAVRAKPGASSAVEIAARVRDPEYRPLDNAKVALNVTLPDGEKLTLNAEPDARESGTYAATYVPKEPGAYRIVAAASAPDGSAVGEREAGWAAQPSADEFARMAPDLDFLKSIAAKTGGEIVDPNRLDAFVAGLSARGAPITEPWTSPLWHQPLFFLAALACFCAEWGVRRVHGLA